MIFFVWIKNSWKDSLNVWTIEECKILYTMPRIIVLYNLKYNFSTLISSKLKKLQN